MERKSKRKATNFEYIEPKRIKNDNYIIINLELLVCEKIRENTKLNILVQQLENTVQKLEKKVQRVEKFNEQLRIKNSKLEKELLEKKEMEICEKLNNLNVKSISKFMDYIN